MRLEARSSKHEAHRYELRATKRQLPNSSFTLLPVNAEIIAVGSEMLAPHRQDTNSLYLQALKKAHFWWYCLETHGTFVAHLARSKITP